MSKRPVDYTSLFLKQLVTIPMTRAPRRRIVRLTVIDEVNSPDKHY